MMTLDTHELKRGASRFWRRRYVAAGSLLLMLIPGARADAAWLEDGVPVNTMPGLQSAPCIATDSANGAVVAWRDGAGVTGDIVAQRVDPDGNRLWAANGVSICAATFGPQDPRVIPDGQGGTLVVWKDNRTMVRTRIYGQRLNSSGARQWALNGIQMSAGTYSQSEPLVISDGSTGYLLAWLEDVFQGGLHFWTVTAHHRLSDTTSLDTSPLVGGTVLKSELTMSSDGEGFPHGAVVAWTQGSTGSKNIVARRITGAHAPVWGTTGVTVCGASGDQVKPKATNFGSDRTVIVWEDNRVAGTDVYAQRLDFLGAFLWAVDGIPVCTAAGNQLDPQIVSLGFNGAFVVWTDFRSGPGVVYGQHLAENGSAMWAPNGIPLCSVAGATGAPSVISDFAGGMIVTWRDNRGFDGDIYAQRVDTSGNLLWSPAGRRLCDALGTQSTPVLVNDSGNGAIVSWVDPRSDAGDIYALRVVGSGSTVDAPVTLGVVGHGARLQLASSNPTPGAMQFLVDLRHGETAMLDVLDVGGRRVSVIPTAAAVGAGTHRIAWDGRDASGAPVAVGTYFVRLTAGEDSETKRVVVVR